MLVKVKREIIFAFLLINYTKLYLFAYVFLFYDAFLCFLSFEDMN